MSLSEEQRWALDRFIKGDNLFITGPGGTGKTFLIKEMV
jgi:DNA replication protein DnaC